MPYRHHKVTISENQIDKILSAIINKEAVSIRFKHDDLQGDDLIAFTDQQFKRIANAFDKGRGVTIKMSETDVQHNTIVEGGFFKTG